jgi:uncharacterized membrane protein YhaH (DUF805 family)
MSPTVIFAVGVAGTGAACLGVILYFAPHLRKLLIELCGTAERADFWLAFSNVMLFLVPVIFALWVPPDSGQDVSAIVQVAAQLKWALAGLVISVLSMGIVLSAYIPRRPLQP